MLPIVYLQLVCNVNTFTCIFGSEFEVILHFTGQEKSGCRKLEAPCGCTRVSKVDAMAVGRFFEVPRIRFQERYSKSLS
jgi:hypothetical protein